MVSFVMATQYETIRIVRDDDLQQLVELYRHLHDDDVVPTSEEISTTWEAMKAMPGMSIIVAELDSMIVSSCVLCVAPNLTRGCRPYGLIENVVTRLGYRRRGIGRRVVRRALEQAWSRDCYKVMLLTGRQDPGTREFYESCGFDAGKKTAFLAVPAT